jgi:hypothetical protein
MAWLPILAMVTTFSQAVSEGIKRFSTQKRQRK